VPVTGGIPQSGDSRPVPDPTALTTEQLHREIGALREFVLGEVRHVREISQTKFEAVSTRTAEQKTDTKDALDAALQAAKDAIALQTEAADKAVAKSETAVAKQIENLQTQLDKIISALTDKVDDLRDRVRTLETDKTSTREGSSRNTTVIQVVIAAVVLIVMVVVAANTLTST
jgi:hypothetical protein